VWVTSHHGEAVPAFGPEGPGNPARRNHVFECIQHEGILKRRRGSSQRGSGHRTEGPGYLVWYETREEAEGWAAVLEEARNASVRAGADRQRQDPLAREKGSGRSRTALTDG